MKEKHFCRCCLSEECYKDMTNKYYFGNKTENYLEMLWNIFNINVINNDEQRCLICEDCVSKLRDAAAFKNKVMDVQEIIKNNLCWVNNEIDLGNDTKIEDIADVYIDEFDDNINDNDFILDNFTKDSQKGQVFVITLETNSKTQNRRKTNPKFNKTKSFEIETEHDGSTNKNRSIFGAKEKDTLKNLSTLGVKETVELKSISILDKLVDDDDDNFNALETNVEDSDFNTEEFDSEEDPKIGQMSNDFVKRSPTKRVVKTKSATLNKDEANKIKPKRREISQTELGLKYKSDNTLKLVQNSNLVLFRSLRNKFECNFCTSKFLEFDQLREHSLAHNNPKFINLKRLRGLSCKNADISNLKCSLCSENCTDLQNLMDHLKNDHEIPFHGTEHYLVPYKLQNGLQCVLCESKFNSFLRLSIHMHSHYTNNVCEICGLSYINRISLRAHVHSQHREKKCSRCPAIFLTTSAKSKHLRQVHGIRNTKRYCNICNKTFKYTYMLDEHKIQEHGVKRPAVSNCVECGKTFLTPFNLKTHVRSVHIKERNYPCTKCGMRFFTTCDQRRHERTHDDVRSFCCSYCDAKFKSKDSWRRHLKRQHGHVFGERT